MYKFSKTKNRIKKNEGFKNKAYFDQIGNPTIGFGHLIKKSENFLSNKKYSKKYLNAIFEKDFYNAKTDFYKYYGNKKLSKNTKDVLIEMIFQLGVKKLAKFKKFNKFLDKKMTYLAALEMINSRWYQQTPKRVTGLIKILLGH